MKPGVMLDDRYELLGKLGGGGMGEVWEARDLRMDRQVAVKMVRDDADGDLVSRLSREARAAGRLVHPHIVAVYDHSSTLIDGRPVDYVVMQLVHGRSLEAELAEGGEPKLRQALLWAAQVAHALELLHSPEVGMVHRDLKPANIMITGGLVKLIDFGIVRVNRPQTAPGTNLTMGMTVGTAQYMAPEQCTGAPVDGRTDLYALGALLFTMLSGQPLFPVELDHMQIMYRQVHESPRKPSSLRQGVPEAVDALVLELLAKDPAGRPGSAAEVRSRLLAAADDCVRGAAAPYTPTLRAEPPQLAAPPMPATPPVVPAPAGERLSWALRVTEEGEPGSPEHDAAVALLAELIPELRSTLGAEHPQTMEAREGYAGALEDEQAIALWHELVADCTRIHGPDSLQALSARFELARSTDGARQEAEAIRQLWELLPVLARVCGPQSEEVMSARELLASSTRDAGDALGGARLMADLILDLGRVAGPLDPSVLRACYEFSYGWDTAGPTRTALDEQLKREHGAGPSKKARAALKGRL